MRRLVVLFAAAALALTAPPAAASNGAVFRIAPKQIDFGTKSITDPQTDYYDGVKITNISGTTLKVVVTAGLPDDFGFGLMPGSTCPVFETDPPMAPGASCRAVVRFTPTEYFAGREQKGTMLITATDPTTQQVITTIEVLITGTGRL